jgi:hypothetical protein
MALPFVTLAPFSSTLTFDELARGLLKEVIEADALMQVRQRAAWREAVGGSEVFEGLDRLENLGLAQVRFTFRLVPVDAPWPSRVWAVLTEPLGPGFFTRVARRLTREPLRFRLASSSRSAGGLEVTLTVAREEDGLWKVHRQLEDRQYPIQEEETHVAQLDE